MFVTYLNGQYYVKEGNRVVAGPFKWHYLAAKAAKKLRLQESKLDILVESYIQLEEVSPEWIGKKVAGALYKIKKAGPSPGMLGARTKLNRVIRKAGEYNKKKYVGNMRAHMEGRLKKAMFGVPKDAMPIGFHRSGWTDAAYRIRR